MILGTINFAVTVGGAVGSYAAGYAFDVTGNYQIAFLFSAGISIVALTLSVLLASNRLVKS